MANKDKCIECTGDLNKSFYTLPCMKLICNDCINWIKTESEERLYNYKCDCKETHNLNKRSINSVSLNEFSEDDDELVKCLIEFEKHYMEKKQQAFNDKSDKLLQHLNESKEFNLVNMEKVRLKCEYMREELEVSYESVIQKLDERKSKLMEQIDKYEIECEKRCNDKQAHFEYNELLDSLENKVNNLISSYNQQNFSLSDLNGIESQINQKSEDYKTFLNSNKDIEYKFEEKIDINPSLLGYMNIKPRFEFKGFDILKNETNLKNRTCSSKFEIDIKNGIKTFGLHPIDDNKILLNSNNLMQIFDINGNLIASKKMINMSQFIAPQIYNFFTIKDSILYKYDLDFNIIAEKKLENSFKKYEKLMSISASNLYVYVLKEISGIEFENDIISQCLIDIYKVSNLQYVKTLHQSAITEAKLEEPVVYYYGYNNCSYGDVTNELPLIQLFTNKKTNKLYVYEKNTRKCVYVLDEKRDFKKVNTIYVADPKCKECKDDHYNKNIKFIDSDEIIYGICQSKGLFVNYDRKYIHIDKANLDTIMVTNSGRLIAGERQNKKIIIEVY